jgi:predicted protein tyrosine phosphatase
MSTEDPWPKVKRWKELYTRSQKVARARQLGFEYPRVSREEVADDAERGLSDEQINLLFVCSKNEWRSPTAETVWRKHPMVAVRSVGTSSTARRRVTIEDIHWADVIFVMEEKHRQRLLSEFRRPIQHKPLHVLDVPDDYRYMDPELVIVLQQAVAEYLGLD